MGQVENPELGTPTAIPRELVKKRERIDRSLSQFSIETPQTQQIRDLAPRFLQETLAMADIPFQVAKMPRTYFIPPHSISEVETLLGTNFSEKQATYSPELNCAIIEYSEDFILNMHRFFHENAHAIGRHILWYQDDRVAISRVGYSLYSHIENRQLNLGEFLEESTNDWIATMAGVKMMRYLGLPVAEEKPERTLAEYSGGRPYSHLRDCLVYLAKDIPGLLELFIQCRFEDARVPYLNKVLHAHYGAGTLRELHHMTADDPYTNDRIVMAIKARQKKTR